MQLLPHKALLQIGYYLLLHGLFPRLQEADRTLHVKMAVSAFDDGSSQCVQCLRLMQKGFVGEPNCIEID